MTFADIRAALALGDTRFALAELRGMLDAVEQDGSAALAEWLGLLARAGASAGPGFVELVRGAARDPDDAAALSALGRRLLDEALPQMAATLLARAHRLAPADEAILGALVAALAADGQHARACAVLRAAPVPRGASLGRRGVLARHAALTGDLDEARGCLPELARSGDPVHQELARTLGGMLARADALAGGAPLDDGDLRGWHFVVTGAVLLHVSPHGRAAGMNGRYAFVHDSYASCREGLRRAAAVLAVLGRPVERVLAPGDRASAILGRAAAAVLGRPLAEWPACGAASAGLVVAYDLDGLAPEAREPLREHRPGQVLYCHGAAWTEEPAFAADLVMRLHQFRRAPWDGHTGVDVATGEPREVAPDEAGVATLAARIAGAPRDPGGEADLAALLAIAEAARRVAGDAATGALRSSGPRRRAWCGSPVSSLRFG
ncbi:MAG TPA: hypothetical protein VFT22_37460 [Kofleriaceae bacterium]|nr:hypothetical protein [Kofleriaceae bacterium]